MGFNPQEIAMVGRRVYESRRADFERQHSGKYVLIDTRTEKVYVADSPEAAYRQAMAERAEGPYYLVRVGHRAAFRSRRRPNVDASRVAR